MTQTFAEQVSETQVGPVRTYVLPTLIEEVVTFQLSFQTLPDYAANEENVQQMVISLLDKGTIFRDRFELSDALDSRGAQLYFTTSGDRCMLVGKCLRIDLGEILKIAAEMLQHATFEESEFEKARIQETAATRRILESTGSMAHNALTRQLYTPAHPNFRTDPKGTIEQLRMMTVEEVRGYFNGHFGARNCNAVFVGDVDNNEVIQAVAEAFGEWKEATDAGSYERSANPQAPLRIHIPMLDRSNLDVRMGHALDISRSHPDYLALYLGIYILGGNFSARLMNSVRDEQGLTYGIGARTAGVHVDYDCYFLTSVTLSGENLERGIQATMTEIERFVSGGITTEELEEKKTTVTGSFAVGLATTSGLAGTLQTNVDRGFGVRFLDDYIDLINALTVDQVNNAIRRYIRPELLHTVVAGTLT